MNKIIILLLTFGFTFTNMPIFCEKTIAVTTMAIGEWYEKITYPSYINKKEYCQLHKYKFHFFNQSLDKSRPHPWSKILILLTLMDQYPETEWFFWTDADSFIMNKKTPLKKFIDEHYDMIVASDFNCLNTGQFFIRNCAWSKDFLQRIYAKEQFINHGWWEQISIIDELEVNLDDKSHVKILKQRVINSYCKELFGKNHDVTYQKGDFIIHFAGVRGDQLAELMYKYGEYINNKN